MYVVSAPLWNSREGHHKGDIFDMSDRYPWIHLQFTSDEIKQMCARGEIAYPASVGDVTTHIQYMMNPENINQRPARDYIRCCAALAGVVVERNYLDLESESVLGLLTADEFADLSARGVDAMELRALTHNFAGRKEGLPLLGRGRSYVQRAWAEPGKWCQRTPSRCVRRNY